MRRVLAAALLVGAAVLAGCVDSEPTGGLPDDVAEDGWIVQATYPNGTVREYRATADPGVEDTDGDGLPDFQELDHGTDPRTIDTDEDGLLDGPNRCTDPGSETYQRFQAAGIVDVPGEPGCFFGETPLEIGDRSENLDPADAFTSDGGGIGNGLTDGEEVQGWEVQPVGGAPYHVWSNPSMPDTDGEGLHDGLEREHRLDPKLEDTDGDGVNDLRDAAPLGDLEVTVTLDEIDLEQSKDLRGGADLLFQARQGELVEQRGPESIDEGENDVDLEITLDVDDTASRFDDGAGAGTWEKPVYLTFEHDGEGGEEPIAVRSGEPEHVLELSYDAFAEEWTGDAPGGTSSGADASVAIDVASQVVAP